MPTFYVDETGFTGEDLLAADQPIFVQASTDFSLSETQEIVGSIFGAVGAKELKHKNLSRNAAHQARIVEFIRLAAGDPNRVAAWVAHKEYAALTMVVEWWLEPLAFKAGLNLYKDGANQAMANMLFMCLQAFWDQKFRGKVLLAFQRMFRARTQERFEECAKLISDAKDHALLDEHRSDILRYLLPSFSLLGLKHVAGLPAHVLDLALPGLVNLGHTWRARHEGPWEVVHDSSSNMAKQRWLWDALSSTDLPPAMFDHPHTSVVFPMNVTTTRFANSETEKQIQLCDLLAGAISASVRLPEGDAHRKELLDAGILSLVTGNIWPTTDVTPEELGKKGWDGNVAIEWISDAVAKKNAFSPMNEPSLPAQN
jgi:Protein of unknown function (DUF3800)